MWRDGRDPAAGDCEHPAPASRDPGSSRPRARSYSAAARQRLWRRVRHPAALVLVDESRLGSFGRHMATFGMAPIGSGVQQAERRSSRPARPTSRRRAVGRRAGLVDVARRADLDRCAGRPWRRQRWSSLGPRAWPGLGIDRHVLVTGHDACCARARGRAVLLCHGTIMSAPRSPAAQRCSRGRRADPRADPARRWRIREGRRIRAGLLRARPRPWRDREAAQRIGQLGSRRKSR